MKISPKSAARVRFLLLFAIFTSVLSVLPVIVNAQTDDPEAMRAKAMELFHAQRMTEALPLFEKLAVSLPKDADIRLNLGFALLGQALNTLDPDVRRGLRVRARDSFVMSKSLGNDSALVQGLIDGMSPDGSEGKGYSDNAAANKYMEQAEAAFSSGKLDEAFTNYQNALKMDPRCYYAALFSGDVFTNKQDYPEAIKWYKKAIDIDPNIETAYRYSATPLMKQGKTDEARDLYVESFITDPYNKVAMSGIIQWGNITKTSLAHPAIDVPQIKMGSDGKYDATINISPATDDGSMAWMSYVTTRESWRTAKFAKTYPKEKTYRHSLGEEADALRSVVSMARSLKPKQLNAQIATLAKMDQDGVLEAYVLMALPDQGIARDHPAYLRQNREKLRLYVVKYVIGSGK